MESKILKKDVPVKITHVGFFDGGEWVHDKWSVLFDSLKEPIEYRTGVGHRKITPTAIRNLHNMGFKNPSVHKLRKDDIKRYTQPVQPDIDGVLYSLVMDYLAGQNSFEDFCSDFGYDTDSRKALETYLACQGNGLKLIRLTRSLNTTPDEITTLYQNY
jgi:hypothetical protein